MTLNDHATAWLEYMAHGRAESTVTRYAQSLRSFLERFGTVEPEAVTVDDLRAWHGQREDKICTRNFIGETGIVKRVLKAAKRANLADALDSRGLDPDPKNIPVTWTQARRALRKTKEPQRSALLLALNSGLGCAELLRLRPEDVEGDAIEVRAHPSWKPRSRKSTRSIPHNWETRACLKKLKGKPHICDMTRDDLAKALEKACKRAGLARLVPQHLRQLFITRHFEKHTHPEDIRVLAGHASLSVTMRYVPPTTGDLAKAQKQIAGVRGHL